MACGHGVIGIHDFHTCNDWLRSAKSGATRAWASTSSFSFHWLLIQAVEFLCSTFTSMMTSIFALRFFSHWWWWHVHFPRRWIGLIRSLYWWEGACLHKHEWSIRLLYSSTASIVANETTWGLSPTTVDELMVGWWLLTTGSHWYLWVDVRGIHGMHVAVTGGGDCISAGVGGHLLLFYSLTLIHAVEFLCNVLADMRWQALTISFWLTSTFALREFWLMMMTCVSSTLRRRWSSMTSPLASSWNVKLFEHSQWCSAFLCTQFV